MVSLAKYAIISTFATVTVIYHAVHYSQQFFPAMKFLATSKISMVVLGNMAFVLTILFGHVIKFIFLGNLREAEIERLYELSRHEVMETCLAMTIFREEFNASFVALFTVLLFVKVFHWLAQKRVEYIETTPSVSRIAHLRIISFLALLLTMDSVLLYHAVSHVRKKMPSVLLLFAFEYVILASSVVATFLKYGLHTVDVLMDGQWDNKAVFVFYLELLRDLFHLVVYLIFFGVISSYYPLPLHLVRDLYETFRNFKARVADFIRYRRITSNMNDHFIDATPEELGRGDATCIVCREEMTSAKKLPCGHLFHVHCLRSWLERQQTCPTCRSPVVTPEPAPAPAHGNHVPEAQPVPEQQQMQQGANNIPPPAQEAPARLGGLPYHNNIVQAQPPFAPHGHAQLHPGWVPYMGYWQQRVPVVPYYLPTRQVAAPQAGREPSAATLMQAAVAAGGAPSPYGVTESQLLLAAHAWRHLYMQAQASAMLAHQMAMGLVLPGLQPGGGNAVAMAMQGTAGGAAAAAGADARGARPAAAAAATATVAGTDQPALFNAYLELQRRQMELLMPLIPQRPVAPPPPTHARDSNPPLSTSESGFPPATSSSVEGAEQGVRERSAEGSGAPMPVNIGATETASVTVEPSSGPSPCEEASSAAEDDREGLRQRRLARFGSRDGGHAAETST